MQKNVQLTFVVEHSGFEISFASLSNRMLLDDVRFIVFLWLTILEPPIGVSADRIVHFVKHEGFDRKES